LLHSWLRVSYVDMPRSRDLWLWIATTLVVIGAAILPIAFGLYGARPHYYLWHSGPMIGVYTALCVALGCLACATREVRFPFAKGQSSQQYPSVENSRSPLPKVQGDEKQILVGDLPCKPAVYRQRKDLLVELDRAAPGRDVSIRSVTGMLGVGKTHLAAEYARARVDDGWRLVGWINAEDETAVLNGLAQVALELGLKADGLDAQAAGRAVRHRLETDGIRCLLVFDAVADLDMLLPFLPAVGDARIVITTNLQAAAKLGASVPVRVDVFSEPDAMAFLNEWTGLADAADARAVAAELGCLPLALAQAAALIAEQHLEYEVYLKRLRELPVEQMLPPVKAGQYPRGVAAAVLLSLDGIRGGNDIGKVCIAVMEMASVLASGGLPRLLLYTAAQSGALARIALLAGISNSAVDEALGRLAGSSLLTFSVDDKRVRAHHLVMRVIADRMKEEKRITIVCKAVGEALISHAESVRQAWKQPVVSDLIDQINTIIDHIDALPEEPNNGLLWCLIRLRLEKARFLDDLGGNPAQAVEDGVRLLMDAQQKLGPDDPCTLTCRHNLAIAYQQAGRHRKAIKLYKGNLQDRARILGTDHPDTLTSGHSLATAYHDAGRHRKAIKLYVGNLQDRVRILGTDHPDTRASRNNLATAYQDTDRIEEAILLYELNLPKIMLIIGTGQPEAPSPPNEPTAIWQRRGRNWQAILLHERTRADGKRTIGPGHPDVLGYQNNLATAYLRAGRMNEAVRLLKHTCEDKERNLGPKHPSTLISQSNLAVTYMEVGRAREAVKLLYEALTDCDGRLSASHRITRIIRRNLAIASAATITTSTGSAQKSTE
jgi:tetratricopeptide (TPR) repeat protein